MMRDIEFMVPHDSVLLEDDLFGHEAALLTGLTLEEITKIV
jgi:hypothetical protein